MSNMKINLTWVFIFLVAAFLRLPKYTVSSQLSSILEEIWFHAKFVEKSVYENLHELYTRVKVLNDSITVLWIQFCNLQEASTKTCPEGYKQTFLDIAPLTHFTNSILDINRTISKDLNDFEIVNNFSLSELNIGISIFLERYSDIEFQKCNIAASSRGEYFHRIFNNATNCLEDEITRRKEHFNALSETATKEFQTIFSLIRNYTLECQESKNWFQNLITWIHYRQENFSFEKLWQIIKEKFNELKYKLNYFIPLDSTGIIKHCVIGIKLDVEKEMKVLFLEMQQCSREESKVGLHLNVSNALLSDDVSNNGTIIMVY